MEIATETPDSEVQIAPPYFAFKTLQNTLEDMKKRGIPNRIDRTFLSGMSGAGQTQFLSGMRSLGLIDAAGKVQPELEALVKADGKERQRLMEEVLKRRYPEAVELGTTNATTGELIEVFRNYGVSGDTARKAIAFYLQAAKYAGNVPLSPMFQTPKVARGSGNGRKRKTTRTVEGSVSAEEEPTTPATAFPQFHQVLAGVLSEFPSYPKGWTQERHDKVMQMFTMAVDFTIPIVDEEEPVDEVEDEEEVEALIEE